MKTTKIAGLALALLAALPISATAAPREPVLNYDEGTTIKDIGDWPARTIWVDTTWVNSKWPTAAVIAKVRADTGLDVRATTSSRYLPDFTPCQRVPWKKPQPYLNCVTASSDLRKGRTARVAVWTEDAVIVAADVTLSRAPYGSTTTKRNAFARVLTDAVGR